MAAPVKSGFKDVTTKYLTSTALIGVLIGFVLIISLIYALLEMFSIQSPCMFVKESIDWGKIEK